MAVRVTLSLDDDLATELRKAADRVGVSLERAVNDSLRSSIGPRRLPVPAKVFTVRAKALHARPGFDFDDIEGLLEQVEGPELR